MTGRTMKLALGAAVVAAVVFFSTQQSYADTRLGISIGGTNLLAGRPVAHRTVSYRGDNDRDRDHDRGRDRDRGRWSRGEHRPLRTVVIPRAAGRLTVGPRLRARRPVVVAPRRQVYRPQYDRQPTIQIRISW